MSSAVVMAASPSGSQQRFGASGSVTAIDINPVLLELVAAQNLSVQQMDLRSGELRSESYDLVTCGALLHQIAEYAPQVLARMADASGPADGS